MRHIPRYLLIASLMINTAYAAETAPNDTDSILAKFSLSDQVGSLKQTLNQVTDTAITNLAKENGYLKNEKISIPLPENLRTADNLLRKFGMGKYADEFHVAMNRAAESAVPEARSLFIGAIKNMSFSDAKNIITGQPDAATQFFRKNTESELTVKLKPIINKSMQKVKLAQKYNSLVETGSKFGLINEQSFKLDDYITQKALDGLFIVMADEEKYIREHPVEATGKLAKAIFSAIKW